MAVSIKVHKGTDTIGGTCIEVIADSGRLILDLGSPLMESGGGELDIERLQNPSVENGVLSDVEGLFGGNTDKPILGVLLSHAHPDHFGLMDYVDKTIPIYMSSESKAMIEVGNVFYPPEMHLSKAIKRCDCFEQWKAFSLGDFTITPYLMDHSAFGASSLLIEVEGKRILYSGDLRAHGRKEELFRNLPKHVGHIDCMLMEGTTLGGKHHVGFDSEEAVEKGFAEGMSDNNLTCVQAAGSNIDRIVSLYRACKRKQKIMVIDLYQYHMLMQAKQFSSALPPHDGDHLRVFFERNQEAKMKEHGLGDLLISARTLEIYPGDMIRQAPEMVLRLSWGFMEKIIQKLGSPEGVMFIYSMWQGYLEKGDRGKSMADMPRKYGGEWLHVHTSGHAWLEDLQTLTQAIQPNKLVPIHTLQGDDFVNYFENVVRIKDGEELVV
jgi:ribonuclease J